MKTIKSMPENLSKRDIYTLATDPARLAIKDAGEGTEIPVEAILIYEDVDKDGEPIVLTSIKSKTGETYTSNSATVRRDLEAIMDIMGDEGFCVQVRSGLTKAGRTYYGLRLV